MALVLAQQQTDCHFQGRRPYLPVSVPLESTTEPGTEKDPVFVEKNK